MLFDYENNQKWSKMYLKTKKPWESLDTPCKNPNGKNGGVQPKNFIFARNDVK